MKIQHQPAIFHDECENPDLVRSCPDFANLLREATVGAQKRVSMASDVSHSPIQLCSAMFSGFWTLISILYLCSVVINPASQEPGQ